MFDGPHLGLPCQFHVLLFPLVYVAQCSYWVNSHIILGILGHPWPVLFLWASSTCFIPWGILGSSHSFILLMFPWAFVKSFGLLWPNYHIFYFWVYWPLNQSHLLIPSFGLLWSIFTCFLLLIIPMGLLLPFLRFPWARLLSLEPFYYFVGLCTIIPAI